MNCPGGAAISLCALISPFVFTFYAPVQVQNTQTNNNYLHFRLPWDMPHCPSATNPPPPKSLLDPLMENWYVWDYKFWPSVEKPRHVQFNSKTSLEGRKNWFDMWTSLETQIKFVFQIRQITMDFVCGARNGNHGGRNRVTGDCLRAAGSRTRTVHGRADERLAR